MALSLFVAVGQDGLRIVSEDGKTWKNQQVGKEGETYRAVAVGKSLAVAVGSYGGGNIFAATSDGKTWKTGTQDAKYVKYLRGLCFGKENFVGLGGDPGSVGSSAPFVMFSTDGLEWKGPNDIVGKEILRRAVWGKDLFVAVGDRGRRSSSTDAKEWKDLPMPKALDTLIDIAFGNGVFVGVGLHGLRMTTKDGKTWSERMVGEEGEHLNSVVWAKDRFVAIGAGATYLSADGEKWERKPNHDAPTVSCFGDGLFVGAKWKGRLMISADGVEWKEAMKCEKNIESIAFGTLDKND